MKNTLKTIGAVLAIALFSVGCNKFVQVQPNEIKGKVFISSLNGTSYKLGSVKISLVNVSDLTPVLNEFSIKRGVIDAETRSFIIKTKDKLEIYEARRDRDGSEELAKEVVIYAIVKGSEFSTNVAKVYDVPTVATTISDADGLFTLSVPTGGKYAIIARDIMMVGERPQQFNWILKWNGEKEINLSSLNTTDIFTPSNEDAVSELEKLVSDLNK